MSFKFDKTVRARAKDQGNYLVGIHITSPQQRSGTDFTHQSPALSKSEAGAFAHITTLMLSGEVQASDVLKLIEQLEAAIAEIRKRIHFAETQANDETRDDQTRRDYVMDLIGLREGERLLMSLNTGVQSND